MKLFSLIQLKYNEFETAVRDYLSKTLSNLGAPTSNSSVFGQIINVVSSVTQNILSYIEDGITEQNKYTAQRKRSIYNLASISGYQPSTGTASTCLINIAFQPNNLQSLNVTIPNKTKFSCLQNGLTYNAILPQEVIVMSPQLSNISRYITLVEGRFETQSFISRGGQLYTQNVPFSGDTDMDYVEVYVNGERWEKVDSLYDMTPSGKQYVARVALKSGIDVIFGDDQNGQSLNEGDVIKVTYLIHSGEYGNIDPNREVKFEFSDNLTDVSGEEVDGNSVFSITLFKKDVINNGTFSESMDRVREMIGYNSRSLVLSDVKNYKQYFSRFSFVGYNRTWSEPGSLTINSLIIKNYKNSLSEGKDYFNLSESDFILSDVQKRSIVESISKSGQQLVGTTINIFDPVITKYAVYIYLKLKTTEYDTTYMTNQIRNLLGDFFSDIYNDRFIPKSDIMRLIRDNVEGVDGVDVYFLSEWNEKALINRSYKMNNTTIYLYDGEDPGLGLDSHGNIYLDGVERFPVLMGGWSFISSSAGEPIQLTHISDPVTIVFE